MPVPARVTTFLLAAATFSLPLAASAAEKIEGAFGLKLGQLYQPDAAPVTRADGIAYPFTPEKPNALFTAYYVYITPNSHLVYRIVGTGEAPSGEQFHQLEERMAAVLNAKYGSIPNASDMIVQGIKTITFFSKAENGNGWPYALTYEDGHFQIQGNEEKKDNERNQLEKRQKELLQAVDTTGL